MIRKREVYAAINRHRNARKLIGLANKGRISRAEASGELSVASAQLRDVIERLEIQTDAPRWRRAVALATGRTET